MLDLTKLRPYPLYALQVFVPASEPYHNIIFMSENSDFITTYPKLNIRRQFVKRVTVFGNKIPRLVVTMRDLMKYKVLGLLPIVSTKAEETKANIFIDVQPFFDILDKTYKKDSYRRPLILTKAISYLNQVKSATKKNILVYHVNLSHDIPEEFIKRRAIILAMISKMGEGAFPFDCVVLAIEKEGRIRYVSIYNKTMKSFAVGKIFAILKSLKPKVEEEDQTSQSELEEPQPHPDPDSEEQNKPVEDVDVSHLPPVSKQAERESILRAINAYKRQKVVMS
jgi:hypothetical protein